MKHYRSILFFLAISIIVCDWITVMQGWWWITLILGFLLRLLFFKGRSIIAFSLCIGCLGWGLPLFVLALHGPALKVASVVESVIGMSNTGGWLIVILTILLGGLLSLLGAWVSTSVMQVYQSITHRGGEADSKVCERL